MNKLVLGSGSPRRQELLRGMGYDFEVVKIDADERFPDNLQGGEIPLYIAQQKAAAYHWREGDDVLITADTIVWVDGQQLGKPVDETDAKRMLHLLSGKTHQVFTGVCIADREGRMDSFVDVTDVRFRPLTEEEIAYYVSTYQPLDKAGAYGIQEWIGYVGCSSLNGSYFNVMGLPTEALFQHLNTFLSIQPHHS